MVMVEERLRPRTVLEQEIYLLRSPGAPKSDSVGVILLLSSRTAIAASRISKHLELLYSIID